MSSRDFSIGWRVSVSVCFAARSRGRTASSHRRRTSPGLFQVSPRPVCLILYRFRYSGAGVGEEVEEAGDRVACASPTNRTRSADWR